MCVPVQAVQVSNASISIRRQILAIVFIQIKLQWKFVPVIDLEDQKKGNLYVRLLGPREHNEQTAFIRKDSCRNKTINFAYFVQNSQSYLAGAQNHDVLTVF